jgi:hypothetical protein
VSGSPRNRRILKVSADPADAAVSSRAAGHLILRRAAHRTSSSVGLIESDNAMARSSTATRTSQQPVPLGSLTQPGARAGASCRACGSERVTRIAMNLTDGSPVEFTSCHRCEHRAWTEQGTAALLPVQRVLDKTRKI